MLIFSGVALVEPCSLRSSFHCESLHVADSVRRRGYRWDSPGPSVMGDSRFAIVSSLTRTCPSLFLFTRTLSLLTTPPVPSALYMARSSSGIPGVSRELSADPIDLMRCTFGLSASAVFSLACRLSTWVTSSWIMLAGYQWEMDGKVTMNIGYCTGEHYGTKYWKWRSL